MIYKYNASQHTSRLRQGSLAADKRTHVHKDAETDTTNAGATVFRGKGSSSPLWSAHIHSLKCQIYQDVFLLFFGSFRFAC